MGRLQNLYKQLSAKYPDILFGYKVPTHGLFLTLSVFDRKNSKARYNKMVEMGMPDQAYVNLWLDMVRDLYGKNA